MENKYVKLLNFLSASASVSDRNSWATHALTIGLLISREFFISRETGNRSKIREFSEHFFYDFVFKKGYKGIFFGFKSLFCHFWTLKVRSFIQKLDKINNLEMSTIFLKWLKFWDIFRALSNNLPKDENRVSNHLILHIWTFCAISKEFLMWKSRNFLRFYYYSGKSREILGNYFY